MRREDPLSRREFLYSGAAAAVTGSILAAGSEVLSAPGRTPGQSHIVRQKEHELRRASLAVQFADDFSKTYGPPDYFDMKRWTKLMAGQARTEGGRWLMEVRRDPPPGPGTVAIGGFATTDKVFNPGLVGTNGVEITLAGFTHEEDYPKEMEEPGGLIQAWSLTIGSWKGLVGGQKDRQKDRGVQLHFDLLRGDGLFLYLVRGLLPGDFDKYPRDGFGRKESKSMSPQQLREIHENLIKKGEIFISVPCLQLANRIYRPEEKIREFLGRSRRFGVFLTDDANTLYWTLDGQVMDSFEIAGYFDSSSESVKGGAFLSIMGLGCFQRNTWLMDDLDVLVSRK